MDIVKYFMIMLEMWDLCINYWEREVYSVDGVVCVFRFGKEDRNIFFNVENEYVRFCFCFMVMVLIMDVDIDFLESCFFDLKDI